jgi:lysophospholipase L1-like esterase
VREAYAARQARRPPYWQTGSVRSLVAASVLMSLVPAACSAGAAPSPTASPTPAAPATRYVALGDSYTIGTSVSETERWPNQLVARLAHSVPLELVGNLGVNGYTSGDLIEDELPRLDALRPQLVSVLIGVNDVVQRVSEDEYRHNVARILGFLLERLPRDRIVVVSTPDYTRTPRGADYGDPESQRATIARFNDVMAAAAAERGIAFVDISAIADAAGDDRSLVARDGLHPSGVQYTRWVDLVAPVVERLLAGDAP